MQGKFIAPADRAGIIPDVAAAATLAADRQVVAIRPLTCFPDEDKFMLAPIEAAHAEVAFGPNAHVEQLGVAGIAGCDHLADMAPIHAKVVDRTSLAVRDKLAEHRF
jgi:hypothetical protein